MTEAPRKPGPKRTGSVEPVRRKDGKPAFIARIRLGDGTRARVEVPAQYCTPAGGRTARERAELYAAARQEQEDEDGALLNAKRAREAAARPDPTKGETVDVFAKRWHNSRASMPSAKESEGVYNKHVSPELGALPIKEVTSDRLLDFVRHLDMKVAAEDYGWKTAINIWACCRKLFTDAAEAKDRTLRVLQINPTKGVPGPDKGSDRQKQMLYPDELNALVSCADVPVERRRLYAFALYTAMRQAEIRALEWTDIDLPHRVIAVTKSEDVVRGRGIKSTKSGKVREVTIEPSLAPLLDAMKKEGGAGKVFPSMPRANGDSGLANLLRTDLTTAKVERAALFAGSETTMPLRFHDLRASGITWRLARGDNPMVVRQETGHADAEVQQLYVRRLREVAGANLFPTLEALLVRPISPGIGPQGSQVLDTTVGATGFEFEQTAEFTGIRDVDSPIEFPRVDVSARTLVTTSPHAECTGHQGNGHNATADGGGDGMLERALLLAAEARRFDVVAVLAAELTARRLAGTNVVPIHAKGHGKPGA